MDSDNDDYNEEEYTYEEDAEYEEDEEEYQSFSPAGLKNSSGAMQEEDGCLAENGSPPGSDGKRLSLMSTASSKSSRSSSGSLSSKKPSIMAVPDDDFIITDCSDVKPLMNCLVNEVSSLLDINTDMAQALLQYNKWDKEKLIDIFFADSEKALKESGLDFFSQDTLSSVLYNDDGDRGGTHKVGSDGKAGTFNCRICCDPEVEMGTAFSLGCGHKFCR
jgi:hypothetical protein